MICYFTRYLRISMQKLAVLVRIMPAPSIIQRMILSSFSSTWIGCVIERILVSIKYTHTHTHTYIHTQSNNGVTILQLSSISSNSIVELLVLVFCLCMHSILFVHAQLNVRAICPSVREMLVYGSCHTVQG